MTLIFQLQGSDLFNEPDQEIILAAKQIVFEQFPQAYNPSLIQVDNGFILIFRHCPERVYQSWLSDIGIVLLDENLNPVTEPELLNTRSKRSKTPSQAEDARIFSHRNKLYIIYNDNIDEIFFETWKRRDMFIAELQYSNGHFNLAPPLKVYNEEKYASVMQQKNWVPFEWNRNLYFSYSLNPHEVITPSIRNGACHLAYKSEPKIDWPYGKMKGSTPPLLVDGEYLAFFHSWEKMKSPSSFGHKLYHYFMGAYTFSTEPPFEITQISPKPIIGKDFYVPSLYSEKRVIFPGGFAVKNDRIYLAYGRNDCEIWIATIDKNALKKSLIRVEK
jgi:predicted GH43/DUF377 family glycosyl hydrolase